MKCNLDYRILLTMVPERTPSKTKAEVTLEIPSNNTQNFEYT